MSSQDTTLNNGRQAIQNTDRSKIFIGRSQRYERMIYANSAYDDISVLAGTPVGRVASTGWIKAVASGAADGSQLPIGIVAEDVTIPGQSNTELVLILTEGDVVSSKVLWQGTDTAETSVTAGVARRLKDWLRVIGINLRTVTENSKLDNQ